MTYLYVSGSKAAKFVNMLDKWFAALSVRHFTDAQYKHKLFKSPYRSCSDREDIQLKVFINAI